MSHTTAAAQAQLIQGLVVRIAEALNSGTNHVRVRITFENAQPVRATLMAHWNNQWHDVGANVAPEASLTALVELLAPLARRGHGGEVLIQEHKAEAMTDLDLQFRTAWIEEHRGDHLASFIEGVLFHDPAGARKDVRRRIRTPHVGA
jgi:hypothetical protein